MKEGVIYCEVRVGERSEVVCEEKGGGGRYPGGIPGIPEYPLEIGHEKKCPQFF